MTAWLARMAAPARHMLRDTMGPWLAVSLSLHAGLIAAVLPGREANERTFNAGGAIAVEIVVVEGPDARVAAATGESGDRPPPPDQARMADRRAVGPAPPEPAFEPVTGPVENAPPHRPAQTPAATAKATPATDAPVILAPRPRPKPAPAPLPPAVQPRPAAPPENAAHTATPGADATDADLAAVTPAPALPGGGSRGASPQAGNPKPVYPDSARRRGRQGRVVLRVEVRPDGGVGDVAIDRSSGDAGLDAAAVAAVRQWRFRPAQRNGVPVAARVRVPIRFRLR